MNKLNLIIENKAESDIELIADYLKEKNVSKMTLLETFKSFMKAFDTICSHPNIGFAKEEFIYRDVRFLVVKKKFLIVYKELDSGIHILRVLSTYQDICSKL